MQAFLRQFSLQRNPVFQRFSTNHKLYMGGGQSGCPRPASVDLTQGQLVDNLLMAAPPVLIMSLNQQS
jgi:hypothetical protein